MLPVLPAAAFIRTQLTNELPSSRVSNRCTEELCTPENMFPLTPLREQGFLTLLRYTYWMLSHGWVMKVQMY